MIGYTKLTIKNGLWWNIEEMCVILLLVL
jgi:hypothetical protein